MTTERQAILDLVRRYAEARAPAVFEPGRGAVPPSGKVVGADELVNMVDACLDGWLTADRYNAELESRLAAFVGCKQVRTVNSGSSANLVALAALTSPLLGDAALKPGDEVITVAAGFPTTINPMLLYQLTPVFVDIRLPTYNIDVAQIEAAVTPRTRAIMVAHTLGNPFDLDAVMALAKQHRLWVIEDCCDALGARYRGRHVGTFGHAGTLSFYPAHQITMGEGGAVFTSDATLVRAMESIRDWGRDCWCAPGADNTCKKRFARQMGELPAGYDHKYIYSHLGYNLKITDIQAACAVAQMDRLPSFVEARRQNFARLHAALADLEDFLILPEATPGAAPSWFGLPLTLRAPDTARGVDRNRLIEFLDARRIGTRLLFAGNAIRQPYFAGRHYRTIGDLPTTDRVMRDTFWIGLWPGLAEAQMDFMAQSLHDFFLEPRR
jgi:CDP-6-deoxy-D-xylo-4-hexulose-3-dehydrase